MEVKFGQQVGGRADVESRILLGRDFQGGGGRDPRRANALHPCSPTETLVSTCTYVEVHSIGVPNYPQPSLPYRNPGMYLYECRFTVGGPKLPSTLAPLQKPWYVSADS